MPATCPPEVVEMRRDSDRRLVVVETQLTGLSGQMRDHETNNRARFIEVHERIGVIDKKLAKQEAYDEQHTTMLGQIATKLDVIAVDQASVANLPKLIKWAAATIG